MLGWSEEDLTGKPVHATIRFQNTDGTPRSEEGVQTVDQAFTRKDGSIFPVSLSEAPITERPGSTGHMVVFHDTTKERAEQDLAKRQLEALTWVGRTRDALDEGRLVLYSQPIVPLAGGEPREELLLRMMGRGGEVIRPATFLPAAEKYGLVGEIDQRVVIEAAHLAAGASKPTYRRCRSPTRISFP